MKVNDNVNHPAHYTMGKIETLDYLEGLPDLDFRAANIIKYVSRYKYKNGVEDLNKAKFYLERLIDDYGSC